MKANELRIGNYVLANIGAKKLDLRQITAEDLCDFANDKIEIEPVKLTEEWLLRFGFKRIAYLAKKEFRSEHFYFELENNELHFRIVIKNDKYKSFGSYHYIGRCKYVHQFQNLYFALTGEELKETKTSKSSNAEN